MTDTPPTAFEVPHSTRGLHSAALNWRHRAFIIAYAKLGFDNPAQAAVDAGVANGVKHGEKIARGYLALPAVQEAIRNTLRTSGIGEGVIRAVVQKWLWHEDPNASLRAAELGARILGMLREPAPAVPLLPPLIVLQAAPSQQVTSPDAVQAEYTVETPIMSARESSGDPRQNGTPTTPAMYNLTTSDSGESELTRARITIPPRSAVTGTAKKAPETSPKARSAPKPPRIRKPRPPRPKKGWRAYSETQAERPAPQQ